MASYNSNFWEEIEEFGEKRSEMLKKNRSIPKSFPKLQTPTVIMEPKFSSKVEKGESKTIRWELKSFGKSHDLLTAAHATSPVVEFENPKVALRYYLQSAEQLTHGGERTLKYYNLCVELLEVNSNCAVNVNACIESMETDSYDMERMISEFERVGCINANESKKGQSFIIIDQYLPVQMWYIDNRSGARVEVPLQNKYKKGPLCGISQKGDITLKLSTELYLLREDEAIPLPEKPKAHSIEAASAESPRPTNSQMTLLSELKAMYTAVADNYPDLRFETKDHMTLSGHKFIVAARSLVFRKRIDDQVKKDSSGGTIKIADINAKPLMIILHWMYTGELHENAGKVMEELVEASVKYQLTDLLKILDKQLITICNPENMFHLHQVAKKYAMPTAITETAAYIRGNI